MTVIGYIFLDAVRDFCVPLAVQQGLLEEYSVGIGQHCEELLVEQDFSSSISFQERSEGKKLLANVQEGDLVLVAQVKWVLGDATNALILLNLLKKKGVSLHCIDIGGDIVRETERKLTVSCGVAPVVQILCEALSQQVQLRGEHSAAIRAGKAKQKKEGKYLGGPVPFGYRLGNDACLHRDEEQQGIIRKMLDMKADRWSYRAIAGKMNEQYNLRFSHEGIRKILLKNS